MTEVTESYAEPSGIDWPKVIAATRALGNHIAADHLEGKGLPVTLGEIVCEVSNYISNLAYNRLDEIGDGQGCETAAARSREAGRLQVAHEDLWDAFRLPRPEPADG